MQERCSPVASFRALLPFYGRNNRTPVPAARRIVENFERTCSLHNVQVPIRQRTTRSNENIAVVQASVDSKTFSRIGTVSNHNLADFEKGFGLASVKISLKN